MTAILSARHIKSSCQEILMSIMTILVTQKVDQVQIGVPYAGIPLSCATCTKDVQEHQALHLVFHTRCRFCRHQMRVLYEALSKEIMNSADYKKAIDLVRWSDARTCSVCLSEHQDSYARRKHEEQIHDKQGLRRTRKLRQCTN